MNKELLKTIDETIKLTCKNIQKDLAYENSLIYLNESIKAVAELIQARSLLKEIK